MQAQRRKRKLALWGTGSFQEMIEFEVGWERVVGCEDKEKSR